MTKLTLIPNPAKLLEQASWAAWRAWADDRYEREMLLCELSKAKARVAAVNSSLAAQVWQQDY